MKFFTLQTLMPCPTCNGRGLIFENGKDVVCPECAGNKEIDV